MKSLPVCEIKVAPGIEIVSIKKLSVAVIVKEIVALSSFWVNIMLVISDKKEEITGGISSCLSTLTLIESVTSLPAGSVTLTLKVSVKTPIL